MPSPYVQSAQLATSGTSAALAYTNPNTAGNALVVSGRNGGGTGGCSDSNANTYAHPASVSRGGIAYTDVFYALNCAAGANTVTYTQGTTGTLRFAIHEYTGIASSAALDGTPAVGNDPGGAGNTTPSSGNLTTSSANDLLFAWFVTSNGTALTPGAMGGVAGAPTVRQSIANYKAVSADLAVSTVGTYSANGSLSAADNWTVALIALILSPIAPQIRRNRTIVYDNYYPSRI